MAVQSARKRPSVEELLGHSWIARHRLQAAQPAASDAVSMHRVPAVARQQSLRKQMPKEEVMHPSLEV